MASCPSCKGTEELHEEFCPEYKPPVDALQFQIYQKHQQIEAMAQDLIRQQKQIEMLQGAFGDMAATIRRLTEERLGSEKSMYQQVAERGLTVRPAHGHDFKPVEVEGVVRLRCAKCDKDRISMLRTDGSVEPCQKSD